MIDAHARRPDREGRGRWLIQGALPALIRHGHASPDPRKMPVQVR
jgi:hypothetical protein